MQLITLLTDDALQTLRYAVGSPHTLQATRSVDSFATALARQPLLPIVLDPMVVAERHFRSLLTTIAPRAGGALLYSELSRDASARIIHAARDGVCEVVIRGLDDAPRLRRRVEDLSRGSAQGMLFQRLVLHVDRLPVGLRELVVSLFGEHPIPEEVVDFAEMAGVHRRSLDRWVARAGFRSPARLLHGARLARAWSPLIMQRFTLERIADEAGYRSAGQLRSHMARLLGMSPTDLRHTDVDRFVSIIAANMTVAANGPRLLRSR